MSVKEDIVKAASRLSSALENNTVGSLSASDFRILKNYGKDLIPGLMMSLSVPHLVSAGSDLYRIILACLTLTDWDDYFLESITYIITNPNLSLEMENLFNYWIQQTIKKLPEILENLLRDSSSLNIYAFISLHKIGRKEGFSCSKWEVIAKHEIQSGLEDYSDKVRSQAFSLVCTSSKTSAFPSKEEFEIVQQFLSQNVNSDNTAMRQVILNSFTNFIIRIRDSLLNIVKSKNFDATSRTQCFPFLDWLHSFLLFNLENRCNYQRKITSLELYKIILTYFGERIESSEKHYTRKTNKDHLSLKAEANKFSWIYKFESESNEKTLLNCLFDEDNDVRLSSASILMSYYKIYKSDIKEFENLFQTGLSLCLDKIFYKGESGALIIHVLVHLSYNSSSDGLKNIICNGNNTFSSVLLSSAEEQFRSLQEDLLRGASQGSFLYGTLQALELLLTDPASPEYILLDKSQMERLLLLIEEVTKFFIAVLSSKSDPKSDYAPSFGEMGMAIAGIVEKSSLKETDVTVSVEDNSMSDLQLTPAQQLVLSCVWLNLKECNKLCSMLVRKSLSVVDTKRCVSLVVSVLRRCRHKGAIESAGLALYHITRHVTLSADLELEAIPAQLMDDFLQSLVDSTTSTVSRRSAGLAILVHRLITGDSRSKKPLLHRCVSKLLLVAANSNVTDNKTLVDLPQSQALHFLRTLVQESSLREHMALYTLNMSLLALKNLVSPVWTIRNAALQLFGALVPKLVGQKPHQEEGRGIHYLAFEELYTHAKPLVEMMLKELSMSAKSNSMHLHSNLMTLLTLITNLTVGLQTAIKEDMSTIVKQFQVHFQQLFKSRIFNVRKLSAKANSLFLSPLELVSMIDQRLNEILTFLNGKESIIESENELQGYLLNISYILERFNDEKVGMSKLLMHEEKVTKATKSLYETVFLSKHSYFVKSIVCELRFPTIVDYDLTKLSIITHDRALGFPYFIHKHLRCMLLCSNNEKIQETVQLYLVQNSKFDVQLSCLKALKVLLRPKSEHTKDLRSINLGALYVILKNFVLKINHNAQLLNVTLEVMLSLIENLVNSLSSDLTELFCPKFLSYSLELLSSDHTSVPVFTFLLPIICGVISVQETVDLSLMHRLSTEIKDRSNSKFDEDVRVHAAKSMIFLIQILKSEVVRENKTNGLIWEACVNFLQDEVTEVRFEASRFVTVFLSSNQYKLWNPYISLERLFNYSSLIQLMVPEQAVDCLWSRMLFSPVDGNCDRSISNPFDHAVKSIYAEETVVSYLAFCCITEILKSCDINVKLKIEQMCNDFNNEHISFKILEYIRQIKNSLELCILVSESR